MKISALFNRVLNGCLLILLGISLILWLVNSNISRDNRYHKSNLEHTSRIRVTTNKVRKAEKEKPKNSDISPNEVPKQNIAQVNHNSRLDVIRNSIYKPWLLEAMRNPAVRKAMIKDKARSLEPFYSDLYKILNINDTTSEKLRELLGERFVVTGESLMEGLAKPEASLQDVVYNQVGGMKFQYGELIAALLGPEKYALFSEFERTMPHRNQIKQFREELEFTSEPLTLDQEIALLPILESITENDERTFLNPSRTPSIVSVDLETLKQVLSEKQFDALVDLKERQKSWHSLNYSWRAIKKECGQILNRDVFR